MNLLTRIQLWLDVHNPRAKELRLHKRLDYLDVKTNQIDSIDYRVGRILDILNDQALGKIHTMADVAQGLSELDPRRRALSDATNDYLARKAHAEAQVQQHFGYGPEEPNNAKEITTIPNLPTR